MQSKRKHYEKQLSASQCDSILLPKSWEDLNISKRNGQGDERIIKELSKAIEGVCDSTKELHSSVILLKN